MLAHALPSQPSSQTCSGALAWRLLLLHAVILAGPAWGQDAGALLRDEERRQDLQRLERLPDPQLSTPLPRMPQPPSESSETIIVQVLRFTGEVDLLSERERAAYAAEAQGQALSIAGLLALADRITFAVQQQGWLLARAVLPPQDVTDGTITIEILDAVLEDIQFQRGAGVRIGEEQLRRLIDGRVQRDAVTKSDLESALLRMNDLPGVTASGRIQAGEAANSSRLVVALDEAPVTAVTAWGDNYGDSSAGRAQATTVIGLADLSGRGERYHARVSAAEGMTVASIGASLPLPASGVSLWGDYTQLSYENLHDIGVALDLHGRSERVALGADYALVRSRTLNLRLSAESAFKGLVDESAAGRLGDRRSSAATLSVSGDTRGNALGGAVNVFRAGMTSGDVDLSRLPSALAADAVGLRTDGHFTRLNGSFARVQNLPGAFSLVGRAQVQLARDNLDSSEDFSLGGPYGVRAYPVGEARGDTGFLAAVELRRDMNIPSVPGNLQLAAFVDTGRIQINEQPNGIAIATATGRNDYRLRGAGLALHWSRERVTVAGTLAHALGSNPGRSVIDGSNADGRDERRSFWLQSAIRF